MPCRKEHVLLMDLKEIKKLNINHNSIVFNNSTSTSLNIINKKKNTKTFIVRFNSKKIQKICESYDIETLCLKANVSDDKDCKYLVSETIKKFKKIDILVNNAGTTKFANHQKLDALTDEDFINIYKVNVIGPYQMIRAVEPYMKKNKFGSVVNVSSIAGITGIGSSIAYAASKGALNTMTLSLAKALGPEIRVNTVCPGFNGVSWNCSERHCKCCKEKSCI